MVATLYTSQQTLKHDDDSLNKPWHQKVYFPILLSICLMLHIYSAYAGWGNTILDRIGFRQAQTAISTYYAIEDGWRLDYPTPVLGSPWSIPFEFPLFQWLVAAVASNTSLPLDQAGRLVSLLCFYACLLPIYALLGHCTNNRDHKLLCLSLLLVSPLYIFWSRTFMIESLALLLSLTFLALALEALRGRTFANAAGACIAGSLAGVTKVTTFVPFFVLAALFSIRSIVKSARQGKLSTTSDRGSVLLSLAIPLVATGAWVSYSDHVRGLNPLGELLVSSALRTWFFGSLEQHLQLNTWLSIYSNSVPNILGSGLVLLASLASFVWAKKYRAVVILCLLAFLSGPLLFTNLYRVHEYYCYATGIFLIGVLGLGLAGLCDLSFGRKIAMIVLIPGVVMFMYSKWNTIYSPCQNTNKLELDGMTQAIRCSTGSDDILVIYGQDWDPSLPYYAQRKSLMRIGLADDSRFQRAINNLAKDKIGAMVVSGDLRQDEAFVRQQVAKFNLAPEPVFRDGTGDLYVKERNSGDKSSKADLARLITGDKNVQYSIDVIQGKFWDHKPISLGKSEIFSLQGWAADSTNQPLTKVNLYIDKKTVIHGLYGFKRSDVAQYYQKPQWEKSGYSVTFDCSKLSPGHHTARLRFFGKDSACCKQSEQLVFNIK